MNATGPRSARLWVAGLIVVAGLLVLAVWRGGVLGLPAVPAGVTAEQSGLASLDRLRERAALLEQGEGAIPAEDSSLALARRGLAAVQRGDIAAGLDALQAAYRMDPHDLVIGNAYRMAALRARRARLAADAVRETGATAADNEQAYSAIAVLEAVSREQPSREATLQLALAWVDELILHPALEVQAPASIESVNHLSELLAREPAYVPALFGRGLNYLHRPTRLVWPEPRKAPPDAASHDISLAVAIGRRIGGASPRLVGTLAMTLGDAYAKEGRPGRARSWWQIAQNACRDEDLRDAVRRRFGWRDGELVEKLEEALAARMNDLDHPLSDLSVIWR